MVVTKCIVSSKPVFLSQLSPRGQKGSHSWDALTKSDHLGTTGQGARVGGTRVNWFLVGGWQEGIPRASPILLPQRIQHFALPKNAAGWGLPVPGFPLSIGQPAREWVPESQALGRKCRVTAGGGFMHAGWARLELPIGTAGRGGDVTDFGRIPGQ